MIIQSHTSVKNDFKAKKYGLYLGTVKASALHTQQKYHLSDIFRVTLLDKLSLW